jgi:hypothetical protein
MWENTRVPRTLPHADNQGTLPAHLGMIICIVVGKFPLLRTSSGVTKSPRYHVWPGRDCVATRASEGETATVDALAYASGRGLPASHGCQNMNSSGVDSPTGPVTPGDCQEK